MDLETYNETVNALNHRCLWARDWPGQILPATSLQHVARYAQTNTTMKPAGLENLLWTFQDLAHNRFIHNTVFREADINALRYGHPQDDPDRWISLPSATIGTFPYMFYYWQQGWDLWERRATPMQHVAPRAYMTKRRGTLLSDWDEILADIRNGLARLQYLPYTHGRELRHRCEEEFTTWDTFGSGTVTWEEVADSTGTAQYYPPYYELDQYTSIAVYHGQNDGLQIRMFGTYETLQLVNPYPYAIEITLIYVRLPRQLVGFVAGAGTCDTTYSFPTPRLLEHTSWNTSWDSFDYGAQFVNSISNARCQTQTITVPAYSTGTFGPTEYDDFNIPTLSQFLWNNPLDHPARQVASESGRVIKIMAYYHPLTENAQTP